MNVTMILNRFVLYKCCALLLLGCTLSFPCVARGQEQQPAPDPPPASSVPAPQAKTHNGTRARSAYRKRAIDVRVQQFSKALNLDETQQAGLKAILERQQMRTNQIRFDSNIAGGDRIGRFRALQEETVLQIRALLNDEQKKKYDPLNHSSQNDSSSGKYLDQWMTDHQRANPQPKPPAKQ